MSVRLRIVAATVKVTAASDEVSEEGETETERAWRKWV